VNQDPCRNGCREGDAAVFRACRRRRHARMRCAAARQRAARSRTKLTVRATKRTLENPQQRLEHRRNKQHTALYHAHLKSVEGESSPNRVPREPAKNEQNHLTRQSQPKKRHMEPEENLNRGRTISATRYAGESKSAATSPAACPRAEGRGQAACR